MVTESLAYATAHKSTFLAQLIDLCAIPSVSTQPDHTQDVAAAARWLENDLGRIGFKAQVIETAGHPVVYAEWLHPDKTKPTVLIYGHYDVQPAEPFELWRTPPFAPTVVGGDLYGRGTCDNKGQHFAHIKACESALAATGSMPCSVKFIIEGEEEIGGPNLPELIRSNRELLACDVVMISDGALLDMHTPSIEYGLRGLMGLELTVRTAAQDLHSGIFGGNIANPIMVLARLLAEMKNDRGVITIPHFYNDVRILELDERMALSRVPINETTMMSQTGAPGVTGEPGFTVAERLGARPTFEINGMWGGYTGIGAKTVLPAEAHAKITCRLVPYMDPRKIYDLVVAYMKTLMPANCELSISPYHGGARAALIDRKAPQFLAAARAAAKTYGSEPLYILEGGSIPVVNDFQDVLDKPVILLGFGLPTDNLHAPNEHFAIACFEKGIEASIRFLDELTTV